MNIRQSNRGKKQLSLGRISTYFFLIIWSLTTIYPLIWVFLNSFKDKNEIIKNSFNLPTEWLFLNYENAVSKLQIFRGYLNSLIISGTTVLVVILIGGLAAYILARFEFKLKKVIYSLVVGSILIPVFATILPVFDMLIKFDLVDEHLGVILPHTAGNLPFAILVLTGFMVTIPIELEEAAIVEGCSTWQVFRRVIIPISKPSLATTAIFVFLWSYNDLFTSLVIMRTKAKMPINVLLTEISSQYGTDYGLMAAVIAIIIIPVLIMYMLLQNQIVEGMTSGAIKG